MRRHALSIVVMLLVSMFSIPASAEDGYAVLSTAIPHANPAPLDWDVDRAPVDKNLSFRILDQLDYPKDSRDLSLRFAGHYMVAMVGCGGGVQCGVLLDVQTGKPVIRLPDTSTGYKFWPDRHLLVVNSYQPGHYQTMETSTDYYVWSGDQFIFLAEEPWPDTATTGSIN